MAVRWSVAAVRRPSGEGPAMSDGGPARSGGGPMTFRWSNTTSPLWPHFSASFKNRLDTKAEKSRKQLKERKNMAKKIDGVKTTKASNVAKKK
ncbi:hypothetical protein WN943_028693 [Citrus x changshan-huyou]